MASDYWLVHLYWTIPPAVILTVAYWPFFTRVEISKIFVSIIIAVLATTPWDSYLIRNRLWTYPSDAVCGYKLFEIPIEEIFFFVIQTYSTSLLYTIFTKHLVLPAYLLPRPDEAKTKRILLGLLSASCAALACIFHGGSITYMGLILGWSLPVLSLQWFLSGSFVSSFPKRPIYLAISMSTIYLWILDYRSLQRGTWFIEKSTKLNIRLGGHLDLEEALFFFISNALIVMGLLTMDNAIAIAEYESAILKSSVSEKPSIYQIAWSYLTRRPRVVDVGFLEGLNAAITKLAEKSQSMYLGSAMFQGRLRIDLVLLYSFCRVIDDLVDEAPDCATARANIEEASQVLSWHFSHKTSDKPLYDYLEDKIGDFGGRKLSPLISPIALLPSSRLSIGPLLELLRGFEMDLEFSSPDNYFPITTELDLELYAYRVAGTVATSLLELTFSHYGFKSHPRVSETLESGQIMGQALQYVNIARDIKQDAALGRVYIPTSWLAEEGLSPKDVIENPSDSRLQALEERMILKAEAAHNSTVEAINELPREARGPVKTTVESYMLIGEMVRKRRRGSIKHDGKLKVPSWRRLTRAWWEMSLN